MEIKCQLNPTEVFIADLIAFSTCFGQLTSRIPDPAHRSLSANLYDIYHCWVYSEWTPDDGQRNCPKHVEFHAENKFVKLVHLVGLLIKTLSCLHSVPSMQHNVNKPPLTSDPAPCLLILSLEQGKQNLWWGTEGHWTKCVSSSRSWHSVHLSVVVLGTAPGAPLLAPPTGLAPVSPTLPVGVPVPSPPDDTPLPLLLSLDVTVVELTWRLPDDRRELVDPAEQEQSHFDSKLQSPDNIYIHTEQSEELQNSISLYTSSGPNSIRYRY